ncbi:MAG: TonB-dependent receptor plug domain-containing protein [Saprospiraceae bacterium]|nr:TonB-dependent receptor plug domain-containing protein [Saprospiraceae bacterium]
MYNRISFMMAVLALVLVTACSTQQKQSGDQKIEVKDANSIRVDAQYLPLYQYLRRLPGVRVMGSGDNVRVSVRGASNTENAENDPLYVLDGVPLGHDYSSLERAVEPIDIDNVSVLKGSEAIAAYGLRGSNGVIIVDTKKNGS